MPSSAASDLDDLLHRARAGEGSALGELLEAHRNYLTLLARLQIGRRLQGKADAADVVQETFLEAQRGFAHFRGDTEAEFAGWLRRILAATLAHLIRRYFGTRGRDVRLERELGDALDQSSHALDAALADKHSSPSQRASRNEQAVLLADALERLPADYREVIILRHLEGHTFPETARRLGRTVDAVEKLWVRALARLRRSLGEAP
jgi:RNA polymerase sigma-70 factor (ECF subfamily)